MNIIILGPPGAGKGTQSSMITDLFDFVQFSTGDILREAVDAKTSIGLKVKDIIAKGDLVADELILEIISQKIANNKNEKGIIFDGFPRTILQADELLKVLSSYEMKLDLVIELAVDENILLSRIETRAAENSGNTRDDDNKDALKKRLSVYRKQTSPLIDYYKKHSNFFSVDGMMEINKVSENIISILNKRLN
ncbi:MAG: adenylate kinase [Alphaproteobacteria bacterium]|jgi:adenylate kinase|tara:strand:- start:31274 stop:31855 length:582 start_codon:yes stop_codon:yes gene_type:complete